MVAGLSANSGKGAGSAVGAAAGGRRGTVRYEAAMKGGRRSRRCTPPVRARPGATIKAAATSSRRRSGSPDPRLASPRRYVRPAKWSGSEHLRAAQDGAAALIVAPGGANPEECRTGASPPSWPPRTRRSTAPTRSCTDGTPALSRIRRSPPATISGRNLLDVLGPSCLASVAARRLVSGRIVYVDPATR